MTTLDGVERSLVPGDGVIANGDDVAIGLAGVMGGAETEIGDGTTSVLVEMAWWDPPSISRTIKRSEPAKRSGHPIPPWRRLGRQHASGARPLLPTNC